MVLESWVESVVNVVESQKLAAVAGQQRVLGEIVPERFSTEMQMSKLLQKSVAVLVLQKDSAMIYPSVLGE